MSSNVILIIYLCFFIAEFITENGLLILNLVYVSSKKQNPPQFVQAMYSDDEFLQSVSYTIAKGKLTICKSLIHSITILTIIFSRILGQLNIILIESFGSGMLLSIVYIFIIAVVFYIIDIPFQLYGQFKLERKYGFSNITVKTWLSDQLKSLILSIILGGILFFILLKFMLVTGSYWWIWSYLSILGFQLVFYFIYPVFIAPLFNKFSPLDEGELKNSIIELAGKSDFPIKEIFVMDASKRSGHSNAYFIGFGKNKRIVLYDTLIEQLNPAEITAVVAHEIGHNKKKHVVKSIFVSFILMFIIFALVAALREYLPLYQAFGFSNKNDHALLTILLFFSSPFLFYLSPFFSIFSRKNEYEADRFTYEILNDTSAMKNALTKLATKNLSNLIPHKWFSFFHYSHPTIEERFKKLDSYTEGSEKT